MTRGSAAALTLRVVAVAIALGGIVDPAITSDRPSKRMVFVSAGDSARDRRLADVVADALHRRFVVARSPVAGAGAAVIVGDVLPNSGDLVPTPAFVVVADSDKADVAIDRLDVPAHVTIDERVPVRARFTVRAAAGRSLDVTARAGGVVVDRVTSRVGKDRTMLVPLSFVPTGLGPVTVQISASLSGVELPAVADALVNVVDGRRSVLFYDPRPSWMSTFVQRAIERDPQFAVTSRVITSRNVSTNTGQPPAALGDPSTLAAFEVVVVGAPSALSAADVAGLEAFMRRRGGSVVFLLDDPTPGPYERLARVSAWSSNRGTPSVFTLAHDDSTSLRSGDVVVPATLPGGTKIIAGGSQAVVWESSFGAGRLIVSGARDAWHFRDAGLSTFDRFWRTLIADAAASAPPPLVLEAVPALSKPGATVELRVAMRDAALSADVERTSGSVRASIAAALESSTPVRMWPEGGVGQFGGTVRAPRRPGVYRFTAAAGGRAAEIPLIVSADARVNAPISRSVADVWARTRGGRLLEARDIGKLPAALEAAMQPRSERTTWHPFRSAWWFVPFVLALSVEWWLRRRKGLR